MAVQPFPYLVMTDGVDTVTFADGAGGQVNWPPIRGKWSPSIAGIRNSQLGGRGPYADVQEDLSCDIRGTTAALAWDNLKTLAQLLDKAERWWLKNENLPPVLLKYAPQGSTLHSNATPMQAVVLGRVGTDELNGVDLPSNVADAGFLFEVDGVRVLCMRRGAWNGASESASASAAANPAVLSITMPSAPTLPGALKVDFTGFTTSSGAGVIDIPPGYVFIGPASSIALIQGESATVTGIGPTFASTADTAHRASGGSVGRLTSIGVTPGTPTNLIYSLPAAFLASTRIALYCTYRANHANGWTINGAALLAGIGNTMPVQSIPAAVNTVPQVLYLGEASSAYGFDTVRLDVASATIAPGNTLDIDTLVAVDLSSNQMYVIAQQGAQYTLGATALSKNATFTVNYDPLTQRAALANVPILTTSIILPVTPSGDCAVVGRGGTLQALWYAPHLIGGTGYWTTQNITAAATLSIGCTITRRLAYLTPQ